MTGAIHNFRNSFTTPVLFHLDTGLSCRIPIRTDGIDNIPGSRVSSEATIIRIHVYELQEVGGFSAVGDFTKEWSAGPSATHNSRKPVAWRTLLVLAFAAQI